MKVQLYGIQTHSFGGMKSISHQSMLMLFKYCSYIKKWSRVYNGHADPSVIEKVTYSSGLLLLYMLGELNSSSEKYLSPGIWLISGLTSCKELFIAHCCHSNQVDANNLRSSLFPGEMQVWECSSKI